MQDNTQDRIQKILLDDNAAERKEFVMNNYFSGLPTIRMGMDNEEVMIILENLIHYVFSLLKKDKLTNEYLEKEFARLSVYDLLIRGKTFFMNYCFDYSIATLEFLKRMGCKEIYIVTEELKKKEGGPVLFHFGLEIHQGDDTYYIDYRNRNDVYIGKGKFASNYEKRKGEIMVLNTFKTDGNEMGMDDNIYSFRDKNSMKFKYLEENIEEKILERLKKINTEKKWEESFLGDGKNMNTPNIYRENIG